MRNRSSMLEILFLAPKNTFELVLSSEIGQFEVEEVNFVENPYISLCTNNRDFDQNQWEIMKNRPPRIQIDLSRSSRGVRKCSWTLRTVFRACWIDCARFWAHRSDTNMISRTWVFFLYFCYMGGTHLRKSSEFVTDFWR